MSRARHAQTLKKLLTERKKLIKQKNCLKKQRENHEKKEEWHKKRKEWRKKREKWLEEDVSLADETYLKLGLRLPRLKKPLLRLTAEVAEGCIWKVPEFLDAVENEVLAAARAGAKLALSPVTIKVWITINTAIREKRLSITGVRERAEFFNLAESRIEFLECSGPWAEIGTVKNTLLQTNVYAQQAMECYINGPKLQWVEKLFSDFEDVEADIVKKFLEGKIPKHTDFINQLETQGLDILIKKKVTVPIDKARETYLPKGKTIKNLIEKAKVWTPDISLDN